METIGKIFIDGIEQTIYEDSVGYFYIKKNMIDMYVDLKSHIKSMQFILDKYPDASLEFDYEPYDDQRVVVVTHNVRIDSGDSRIIKLLEEKKIEQIERDKKILDALKKRSPELFK